MTLLDTDTLLCLIKLINCLMDHKSAGALMGPGVLCWFKYFHITMSKVYGTNPALISTTSQRATYSAATCVTPRELYSTIFITNFMALLKMSCCMCVEKEFNFTIIHNKISGYLKNLYCNHNLSMLPWVTCFNMTDLNKSLCGNVAL